MQVVFKTIVPTCYTGSEKADCVLWGIWAVKGLVYAMSRFEVKDPLRRAVINNDFTYKIAEEILVIHRVDATT